MATTARNTDPGPIHGLGQGMGDGVPEVGRLPARQHVLDLDDFTADEIEQVPPAAGQSGHDPLLRGQHPHPHLL